jgi:hypothetical protein
VIRSTIAFKISFIIKIRSRTRRTSSVPPSLSASYISG